MKVLLTGASGFVGSHILDCLRARGIATVLLLRSTSPPRFLGPHLPHVQVCRGSIDDRPSLLAAMAAGITHVIHCAGATKAARVSAFYQANQAGTRNVVEAINAQSVRPSRLVHVSSLAAAGPATAQKPAREDDPPLPVSEYGKSKLAGELEVRNHCRTPFVILRPPAVYGPRDEAFLPLFRAVKRHLLPCPTRHQALSLVYTKDLAEAAVICLDHPAAEGKTYFVASKEVVTGRQMAQAIAHQMGVWRVPLPLPAMALWPLCLVQELLARLTGRPRLLNLAKYVELRAPGWVCDPGLMRREIGYECKTGLQQGIAETRNWYLENRWL